MANEKPPVDDDRLAVETLIVEAIITVEAIGAGLERMVATSGNTPDLITAGKCQVRAKDALVELDDLIRAGAPEADANG